MGCPVGCRCALVKTVRRGVLWRKFRNEAYLGPPDPEPWKFARIDVCVHVRDVVRGKKSFIGGKTKSLKPKLSPTHLASRKVFRVNVHVVIRGKSTTVTYMSGKVEKLKRKAYPV